MKINLKSRGIFIVQGDLSSREQAEKNTKFCEVKTSLSCSEKLIGAWMVNRLFLVVKVLRLHLPNDRFSKGSYLWGSFV